MTPNWPTADLDQVRRMRVLAASIPGVVYAEEYVDVPFDRVWEFVADMETSIPALVTDVRSFRIVRRDGRGAPSGEERFMAKAIGLLGNRGAFDVVLEPGWCLMQSRFVVGGMAATPEGGGTRFAGCGALRNLPGARLLGRAAPHSAERIIAKVRARLG
jgi:hypothetical protein